VETSAVADVIVEHAGKHAWNTWTRNWKTGMEEDLRMSRVDGYTPQKKMGEGSAGTVNETMMLKIWHDAEVAHALHSVGGARTTRKTTRAEESSGASGKKVEGVRGDDGDGLKIPWQEVDQHMKDRNCNCCSNLKNGNTWDICRKTLRSEDVQLSIVRCRGWRSVSTEELQLTGVP
jgi:hypothetical protein